MLSPIFFCKYCNDEFDRIEGNDNPEFCSWDCQEKYEEEMDKVYQDDDWETAQQWEDYVAIYNEGFGRKVL
jgi:hypothetical protein